MNWIIGTLLVLFSVAGGSSRYRLRRILLTVAGIRRRRRRRLRPAHGGPPSVAGSADGLMLLRKPEHRA